MFFVSANLLDRCLVFSIDAVWAVSAFLSSLLAYKCEESVSPALILLLRQGFTLFLGAPIGVLGATL